VLRLIISAPDYTIRRHPSQPSRPPVLRRAHMVLCGNRYTSGSVLYCCL